MLDKIKTTLARYENAKEPFDEYDVHCAIEKLRDKTDTSKPQMEWVAEYIAFGFYEDSSEQGSIWGTYFGPMMSGTNKDGSGFEVPSLSDVTNEILNYWSKRAKEAKHPILKTRYAALVWEFSRKVANQPPDIEMAHICIDSVIEMGNSVCHKYEVEIIRKMEYAVGLAIGINDKARLNRLRDGVIIVGDNSIDDKIPGLLDFSFDTLLMNEKVQLDDGQEVKIVNDLESRLEHVSNFDDKKLFDPFVAEDTSIRLAQYYRTKGKSEEIRRVLLKYGHAFEQISVSASGSLAIAWLQKVESVYRNFGLKDESNKVLNIIRQRGPDAQKDLRPISVKQEISHEEMDNYVNAMVDGDINTVMSRIAVHYIPKKDKEIQTIKDLAQKNPLSYDMSAIIQDRNGRTIARIGPLEKDLDGHLVKHIAQGMHFSYIFLLNVLHKFKEKFSISADSIMTELSKSPVFMKEKANILKRGLDAYFSDDHIVSVHLLVPQVENAVRRLLELTGGTTYKPSRNGGYFLKTMDEMLRDEGIIQSLGEDATLYMRILYTDPRGWNLRNNVCHGMSMPEEFCQPIADRVFHTLLLLGLIREHKKEV